MTSPTSTVRASRPLPLREPRFFPWALILAASVPALYVASTLASDILRHTRLLGSNPVKEAEHLLGDWTLRLLVATLCVSPLRRLTGWHWLGRHRRTLGLFAFGYATLHWLTYVFLDVQLDWGELIGDLKKRPYIMVGMAGLLLLLPLAATSTQGMIRRLGGLRWRRLHKLIFAASVLGVIHYWMSVKADIRSPLTYAAAFTLLIAYRLVAWRKRARPAVKQPAV